MAAAAGAHANPDPNLTTSAYFLMLGAGSALSAIALATARGPGWSFADVGGLVIALGAALFGSALGVRAVWGLTLFPMAAPIGGTMLISGWLLTALAAFERRRGG